MPRARSYVGKFELTRRRVTYLLVPTVAKEIAFIF